MKSQEKLTTTVAERKRKEKRNRNVVIALLFVGLFGVSIIASQQYTAKNDAIDTAQAEQIKMSKEHELAMLEIEANLYEITAHEEALRKSFLNDENNEGAVTMQQRIDQELAIIQELINRNKDIIAQLESDLGNSNTALADMESRNKRLDRKVSKFEKRIDELEKDNADLMANYDRIAQEYQTLETEFAAQTEENEALNQRVLTQGDEASKKDQQIAELKETINTSFYIVGDYKELEEMDVVEKEGGILGLGANKTLKKDFEKAPFIEIDRQDYTTIPVYSKKAELATNHPSNSYKWVENDEGVQWLEITNPSAFWENSKYLVILTDKKFNTSRAA